MSQLAETASLLAEPVSCTADLPVRLLHREVEEGRAGVPEALSRRDGLRSQLCSQRWNPREKLPGENTRKQPAA